MDIAFIFSKLIPTLTGDASFCFLRTVAGVHCALLIFVFCEFSLLLLFVNATKLLTVYSLLITGVGLPA